MDRVDCVVRGVRATQEAGSGGFEEPELVPLHIGVLGLHTGHDDGLPDGPGLLGEGAHQQGQGLEVMTLDVMLNQ